MKAIILTMTSGEGHNSIAKSLARQFEILGVQSQIVDIFAHNKWEYQFNNLGYLFACKYFPKTYDYFWRKLKFRNSDRRYHGVAQREVDGIADFVFNKIKDEAFDFFVAVHPYCAMLCDKWKRQGRFLNKKAFAVLPDALPHPLWESAVRCDYVLTPTQHAFEQLQQKGFDKNQLVACGFPVADSYLAQQDKQQLRQKLGLKDKFTVLICGGGFGVTDNWKIAKQLLKADVQILCVNGRNQKMYKKIQRKTANAQNFLNFGFVDNLHELMSCSDVIITKAGGGTLFEATAKRLPIVIREKPIINERENAQILQQAGAAIVLKNAKSVAQTVQELQNNPQKCLSMQNACAAFAGGGVKTVCSTIMDLLQGQAPTQE